MGKVKGMPPDIKSFETQREAYKQPTTSWAVKEPEFALEKKA